MNDLSALLKSVEEEQRLYEEFFALERAKTKVLVDGDVAQLDKIVNAEQAYIRRLTALEKQRQEMQNEIGLGSFTLSQIIAYHVKENKEHWQNVFDRLIDVLNQLKKTNDINQRLIKSRLDTVNFIIGKLGITDDALLGAGGEVVKGKKHKEQAKLLDKMI